MDFQSRVISAIEKVKEEFRISTNELLSKELRYKALNYVSDIVGGSKPITDLFIGRLKERFNINEEYLKTGKGSLFINENSTSKNSRETLPVKDDYDLENDIKIKLSDYINAIKEQTRMAEDYRKDLMQVIAPNLNQLVEGQQMGRAQLKTLLELTVVELAGIRKQNPKDFLKKVNKVVNDNLKAIRGKDNLLGR